MIDWTNYKIRQRFYHSKEWLQIRQLILSEKPLCVHCESSGHLEPATEIDHIIDIEYSPELRLERSNLQPLCKSCHSKKTYDKVKEKLHKDNTLKPITKWKNTI